MSEWTLRGLRPLVAEGCSSSRPNLSRSHCRTMGGPRSRPTLPKGLPFPILVAAAESSDRPIGLAVPALAGAAPMYPTAPIATRPSPPGTASCRRSRPVALTDDAKRSAFRHPATLARTRRLKACFVRCSVERPPSCPPYLSNRPADLLPVYDPSSPFAQSPHRTSRPTHQKTVAAKPSESAGRVSADVRFRNVRYAISPEVRAARRDSKSANCQFNPSRPKIPSTRPRTHPESRADAPRKRSVYGRSELAAVWPLDYREYGTRLSSGALPLWQRPP